MKLFSITLLAFSFFIMISCNNHKAGELKNRTEKTYNVTGKIEGRDSGWLYLGIDDTSQKSPLLIIIIDSAKILHSNFQFKNKLVNSMPCKIMTKDIIHGWPYTHYFILDTGITNVHLYIDSMANSVITGPESQEQFMAFNRKLRSLGIPFEKNYSLNKKGIISDDSLNTLEKAFNRKRFDLILQQVKANPGSIVSAFIARQNVKYDTDLPTFEEIYNLLTNKDNYYARWLLQTLTAKKQTEIGIQAPYFSITDNKNQEMTNDFFKGKYLLLDFWASWCVPCRQENPNLVKAYKKYADKGLEMVSISSDIDIRNWENAVKKDKLSWIQACDSQRKIGQDFGVLAIPSNFLIDKDGKIVAKNLSGDDIEKVLRQYLSNN